MAKDKDGDYFYDAGTINEQLENFQLYEKNGELHFEDKENDNTGKINANGEFVGLSQGSASNPLPAVFSDNIKTTQQDLSTLTLGASDDGKVYFHNGNSSITADGGTTSESGLYRWDNTAGEFKSLGGGGGGDFVDSGGTQRTVYIQASEPTLSTGDLWFET